MARNKRASMREGPLADLFRSTAKPDEQPTQAHSAVGGDEPVEEDTRVLPPSEPPREEPEPESADGLPFDHQVDEAPEEPLRTPDPEPVRAYRLEERGVERAVPEPKDRLSRIFADEPLDPEGPLYGRDDPSPHEAPSGPPRPHEPIIRVVGVGGAGVNAVNRMVDARIPGVEFMAINTDLQSLQQSSADVTVHLGSGVARGLGAGSDPGSATAPRSRSRTRSSAC